MWQHACIVVSSDECVIIGSEACIFIGNDAQSLAVMHAQSSARMHVASWQGSIVIGMGPCIVIGRWIGRYRQRVILSPRQRWSAKPWTFTEFIESYHMVQCRPFTIYPILFTGSMNSLNPYHMTQCVCSVDHMLWYTVTGLPVSTAKLSDLYLSILYPVDGHCTTDSLQGVSREQRKLNYICQNKYTVDGMSDFTMSKSMGPSNTRSSFLDTCRIFQVIFRCSCTLSI